MNFISRHCSSAANGLWDTATGAVNFVTNRNVALGGVCLAACAFQQNISVLVGLAIGVKWHVETNEFFDKISAVFDYYLDYVDESVGGWRIPKICVHAIIGVIAALAYKILLPISIVIFTPVFCAAMLSANLVTAGLKHRDKKTTTSED